MGDVLDQSESLALALRAPALVTGVAAGVVAPWHVLQTLPRQEKALARDLGAMKVEHYLPVRRQVRTYGRRKVASELPLFPGYLFLRGDLDDAYNADRTGRVARILPVVNQRQLQWELDNLRRLLAGTGEGEQTLLDPYPFLVRGIRVVVARGPLKGTQGLVEAKPRPDRLILQIETLGQAVSLSIDAALLEPLDDRACVA